MTRRANRRTWTAISVVLMVLVAPTAAKVIYVDANAPGPIYDGSSWSNAYNYLQDALADADSAAKPVEICVAQGIYKPDQSSVDPNGSGDRYATFQLINGVTLKGGYAGLSQPDPNKRDPNTYESILSGDLAGNDLEVNDPWDLLFEPSRYENSYHVFTGTGIDYSSVLDGLTIVGGFSSGMYNDNSNPTLYNCNFKNNSEGWGGGGMHNWYSNPKLTNCTFIGNMGGHGGGMYNYNSNPVLINCSLNRNYAQVSGGGIYNQITTSILLQCSFTKNSAGEGGGMYNWDSRIELKQCEFTGNWSDEDDGGGIHSQGSDLLLTNCTLKENSAKDWAGGMLNASGNLICLNCSFERNLAVSGSAMVNSHSSAVLENCEFTSNLAKLYGGAIHHYWSDITLTNCVFVSNRAIERGGAIGIGYCDGMLINCTFIGNSSNKGGAICISTSHPILTNCIMWGDISEQGNEIYLRSWDPTHFSELTINYSNLKGGPSAVHIDPHCILNWDNSNIDADPYFADVNNGDYHLKSQAGRWDANSQSWVKDYVSSPCIDAGNPGCPVGDEPAPNGNRKNMGAYGGTAEASKSPAYWRSIADLTNDWIVDSNDLKVFVSYWLQTGECIPSDFDRSRSVDFNDFAILGGQWSQKGPGPGITYEVGQCIPIEPASSTAEEPGETRFTVTVEGSNINFQDLITANCCADEIELQMTVAEDLITIYEIEHTPMPPCPCICDYPTTATLGPFEPGTYIFAVYQNSSFIGSTTVTIEDGL